MKQIKYKSVDMLISAVDNYVLAVDNLVILALT